MSDINAPIIQAADMPAWLNTFTPDKPWKKAAWCLSYRDMLNEKEAFHACNVCMWAEYGPPGTVGLDLMFGRLLWLVKGLRWVDHPLCDAATKGVMVYQASQPVDILA